MDYHKDRFDDHSLLVFKDDELIAILPANIIEHKVISHQGLSYGGLVVNDQLKFHDFVECFYSVLRFLNEHGVSELKIKIIPKIYNLVPSDELDYLLFIAEAQKVRCDVTSVIDYAHRFDINSSNRKRGLKRAKNNNLVVKEVNDFTVFWNEVLIPNLRQRHEATPTHSLDEITVLKDKFPDEVRQFNVFHGSKLVGGATVFETPKVAHVQYISANAQKQELGSLDLLFDVLINSVFKEKAYFDFGISNVNNGKNINSGLLNWKEDFGARSIIHDFYIVKTEHFENLKNIMI